MKNRKSDDINTLIRCSELLSQMLDEVLTESYITPETIVNYHENLQRCKKAVKVIKEKCL